MRINIFDLTGHTPNLFQYERLNIISFINTILSKGPDNDSINPIFHEEPEIPKPQVEYYRQSAVRGLLLKLDDIVFKDHWNSYHSFYDSWNCICNKDDKTEWCYCARDMSSQKCSQWQIFHVHQWIGYMIYCQQRYQRY